jgi:hypothetical protein
MKKFQEFKEIIGEYLRRMLEAKGSMLRSDDRQNLITICYIDQGIEILSEYEKYERDAVEL